MLLTFLTIVQLETQMLLQMICITIIQQIWTRQHPQHMKDSKEVFQDLKEYSKKEVLKKVT